MSDQGKEEQVGIELDNVAEIKNYIAREGTPLESGLIDITRSSRMVLLGNIHSYTFIENLGTELAIAVANLLPALKVQAGLTCVAVELDSIFQQTVNELNPDDPELEAIIKDMLSIGRHQGDVAFLAAAKRFGLKIICIDLAISRQYDSSSEHAAKLDLASVQNMRDEHMFRTIEERTNNKDKTLVLIGNDHIHSYGWEPRSLRAGVKAGHKTGRV